MMTSANTGGWCLPWTEGHRPWSALERTRRKEGGSLWNHLQRPYEEAQFSYWICIWRETAAFTPVNEHLVTPSSKRNSSAHRWFASSPRRKKSRISLPHHVVRIIYSDFDIEVGKISICGCTVIKFSHPDETSPNGLRLSDFAGFPKYGWQ